MNIIFNGQERVLARPLSIADLVDELAVPPTGIAVAVDEVVVPRSTWATTVVTPGARVDVVTAMQGG
jgi:sulfur carrier protein